MHPSATTIYRVRISCLEDGTPAPSGPSDLSLEVGEFGSQPSGVTWSPCSAVSKRASVIRAKTSWPLHLVTEHAKCVYYAAAFWLFSLAAVVDADALRRYAMAFCE